ncbi:MAG: hypothetical protein AB7T27_12490 [Kiritimatiellia bacterium]
MQCYFFFFATFFFATFFTAFLAGAFFFATFFFATFFAGFFAAFFFAGISASPFVSGFHTGMFSSLPDQPHPSGCDPFRTFTLHYSDGREYSNHLNEIFKRFPEMSQNKWKIFSVLFSRSLFPRTPENFLLPPEFFCNVHFSTANKGLRAHCARGCATRGDHCSIAST